MSLIYFDGFDNYKSISDITQRTVWASAPDLAGPSFSAHNDGRSFSGFKTSNINGDAAYIATHDLGPITTLTAGVGFNIGGIANGKKNPIISLVSTNGTTEEVKLWFKQDITNGNIWTIMLSTSQGGEDIATAGYSMATTGWHYVEVQATIGGSGNIKVKVNGIERINTPVAYTPVSFDGVRVYTGNYDTLSKRIDDVYILDSTGSTHNDFIGPVRIHPSVPSAAGSSTDFTSKNGGANFTELDESLPDDNATYVFSSTPNATDTYNVTQPSVTGSLEAIKIRIHAEQAVYGPNHIAIIDKMNASERTTTRLDLPAEVYSAYEAIYQNMADGSAISDSSVGAAEFGFRIQQ